MNQGKTQESDSDRYLRYCSASVTMPWVHVHRRSVMPGWQIDSNTTMHATQTDCMQGIAQCRQSHHPFTCPSPCMPGLWRFLCSVIAGA